MDKIKTVPCLPLRALIQVCHRDPLHLSFNMVQLFFYQLSMGIVFVSRCGTDGFWKMVLILSLGPAGTYICEDMCQVG